MGSSLLPPPATTTPLLRSPTPAFRSCSSSTATNCSSNVTMRFLILLALPYLAWATTDWQWRQGTFSSEHGTCLYDYDACDNKDGRLQDKFYVKDCVESRLTAGICMRDFLYEYGECELVLVTQPCSKKYVPTRKKEA